VVVPPKFGFGSDSLPTGITSKTTLVFVIDLLGIRT
jgi:FKBP-type peptidyl-prolyl cis-trans isomerase